MKALRSARNMLKEEGLVTKIDGDIAWVNTQSKLACASCKVESTCGNALLEKYFSGKIFVSKVRNTLHAQPGDEVVIGIEKSKVTQASLLVYFVPILGLFTGALIGEIWFESEFVSITLGLLIFIASFLFIRLYFQRRLDQASFEPRMIEKVTSSIKQYQFDKAYEKIKVKEIQP